MIILLYNFFYILAFLVFSVLSVACLSASQLKANVVLNMENSFGRGDVMNNTMLWLCSDDELEGKKESFGSADKFKGRKCSLYEGGIRWAGILEWPVKVRAGGVSDFSVVTCDFLPSILNTIQVDYAGERLFDGISLFPVLSGELTERPDGIGFESSQQLAWSINRYKLYSKNEGKSWELYDLIKDLFETKNIQKHYSEVVANLSPCMARVVQPSAVIAAMTTKH
jgi:arylsulfatase A-like enzyme